MELSGIHLGGRDRAELDWLLASAEQRDLSYEHSGSTLRSSAPPGVPDRRSLLEVAGSLAAAERTLRAWAPHRGIRARVHPESAPVLEGTTLLVVASLGPLEIAVPNRIVAVVEEPDQMGFAYGTLTGHVEAGEELFLAEQVAPGRLRLTVRVQARPATTLVRLGGPLVSWGQRAAARRYLAAWAAAITREG